MSETYRGSITLASVTDGQGEYLISSSDEMIYKFYNISGKTKEYSPSSISFWVTRLGSSTILTPGIDYDDELELIGATDSSYNNLWSLFDNIYIEDQSE